MSKTIHTVGLTDQEGAQVRKFEAQGASLEEIADYFGRPVEVIKGHTKKAQDAWAKVKRERSARVQLATNRMKTNAATVEDIMIDHTDIEPVEVVEDVEEEVVVEEAPAKPKRSRIKKDK